MKKQDLINRCIGRFYHNLLVALILVTLLYSCNRRDINNKLIPEKDLVDVLTEIYIADGLLIIPKIRSYFALKDSITNYIDIINRHGFTKERMDKTMQYYFDKNPKKLENIYDQVLTKLSEKQAILEKETGFRNQNPNNLWNKSYFIEIPESTADNNVWFSISAKDTGNYILEFTSTIFRDDKSRNPRVTVFFWRSDSSKTGNKINWEEVTFPKDGKSHSYSLSKRNSDTTFTHIGGWLLNSDTIKGSWKKHAKIENIILRKAEPK
jgi:hypothetical protein